MEKSSQIAWKIVPLIHFFPLKVVPLIEVPLYFTSPIVSTVVYQAGRFFISRKTHRMNSPLEVQAVSMIAT
jgi:hypothetical protein